MKKITIALPFLLCFTAFGQANRLEKYSEGEFWLRNSLLFGQYGDTKILASDVYFPSTNGRTLRRGEKVFIASISDEGEFARLRFSSRGNQYSVLVINSNRETFRNAFNLFFSRKPIDEYWVNHLCESKMKSRSDVIQCLGFPLDSSRTVEDGKDLERLYYTCWYVGNCGGFDTYTIELTKGKVTNIAGSI